MNNKNEINIIYEAVGGSRSYGLETPESDTDIRGVYLTSDISQLTGLNREAAPRSHGTSPSGLENESNNTNNINNINIINNDTVYYELVHWFRLLKNTNTQVVELLFNKQINYVEPTFQELVLKNRYRFLDTQQMYKSICGYIFNEKRLAFGEKTGRLGGKRKAAIDSNGFSHKNFVQLIRLSYCGKKFFETGHFPVNLREENPTLAATLMMIKQFPETYAERLHELKLMADTFEIEMKIEYEKREIGYEFDCNYANYVILSLYEELIDQHMSKY